MLDISKIEAGRVELEQSPTDLHHLLHEIQSLLNIRAVEKGLHFRLALAANLPRYIVIDAGKLRQVLINLVGNALKFTRQGEVILRVERNENTPEKHVILSFAVEDTGPGIREENLQRLFTPFVQLGEQPPTEAGPGLGLTISRQFVELMHGRLDVKSVSGKGSVFHFDLPAAQSTDSTNAISVSPQHGAVIGLEPGQASYRLLVAEDQPENRLLLHKLLEPLGFEMRDALNGQEAVTQFEQWRPDLIWMDIRMPVMDGLEATRLIRANDAGSKVPIIALTAHALEEERLKILEAGCDDFVRKPYRENEIYDALTKHLDVRFRYSEQPAKTQEQLADQLDMIRLESLPLALLSELRKAAELLDQDRCIKIAGQISDIDYALGAQLRHQVEIFHYQELLDILDRLLDQTSS